MKKVFFLIFVVLCFNASIAQIVHYDDADKIHVGNRLRLQSPMFSSNGWVRGIVGSSIHYNGSLWDVGYNNQTDFAMMEFTKSKGITFYTRADVGDNYTLTNTQLVNYARMYINENGLVGIGANALTEKLTVWDDSVDQFGLVQGTGISWQFRVGSNGSLIFKDDGQERIRFNEEGFVGIGTNNPKEKLHVNGTTTITANIGTISSGTWEKGQHTLELQNDDAGDVVLALHRSGQGSASIRHTSIGGLTLTGNGNASSQHMHITSEGRVGIGTPIPTEKLHVNGTTTITANIGDLSDATWNTGQHTLELQNSDGGDVVLAFHRLNNGSASIRHSSDGGLTFTGNGNHESKHMHITSQGEVAIGTMDFSGNHKLRVEGSIGARSIKVEADGWSDFVFEDNYELRSLEETEMFITKNNHLPEIPSESEVTENGINLGEMDAKLLQKIEELTLYLIEQNKQIVALQKEVSGLRKN